VGWIDNTVEDAYREIDGKTVDREAVMTPEWNVNGLARYEWDALSGVVAVQGDFTYMDDHYFQLKNSPVGSEDAYTIYNTRVSYTGGSGNWTVTGFVNNVTDEEYRQMVFDLAGEPAVGGFGMYESSFGLPRWWGVSYRYQWGN
jgi:iron complex outermembrane receptor protein